ncbi:kinase-like domain-containing protein [Cunninghamella echinulata]|nr:kinase-like domain-containing protein [Cunninghamella echinulata]
MNFEILEENYKQVRQEYNNRNRANNDNIYNQADLIIKNVLDNCERRLNLYKESDDDDDTLDQYFENDVNHNKSNSNNNNSGNKNKDSDTSFPFVLKRSRDQVTTDNHYTSNNNNNTSNIVKVKSANYNPALPTPTESSNNNNKKSKKLLQNSNNLYDQHTPLLKNIDTNQYKHNLHDENHLNSIEQPRGLKINQQPSVNITSKTPTYSIRHDLVYKNEKKKNDSLVQDEIDSTKIINVKEPFKNTIITIKDKEYTILDVIGKGGYGSVYRVIDKRSNNILAIKDAVGKGEGDELKKNILNEIYFLNHAMKKRFKYTVEMFDYEVLPYGYKIAMELGDIDFLTILKDQSKIEPLNMNFVRYYWGQMLLAVKEWHDISVVHKDLKPPNFILKRGRLKLIDFGASIALKTKKAETSDRTIGTVNYMAPETLCSPRGLSEAGLPSDIWSLGCILYEMIYFKPPLHKFNDSTKKHILIGRKHNIEFRSHIDWISPNDPSIHKSVYTTYIDDDAINCMKLCLNYNPKERPTIDQLLQHAFIKQYEKTNTL